MLLCAEALLASEPMKVYGKVHNLKFPDDVITVNSTNVNFSAMKTFVRLFESEFEAKNTVNGIDVEKICNLKNVLDIVVTGIYIYMINFMHN